MRTPLVLLAALALLVGCGTTGGAAKKGTLSFGQEQTINAGVSAQWLLQEFPFAKNIRRHGCGSVAQMGYRVTDPQNKGHNLTLFFDERGILVRKHYDGPLVRSPVEPDPEDCGCPPGLPGGVR